VIYEDRPELLDPFLIGLAIVPLVALTSLRQAAMQGLGRVVLGRIPDTLLAPALFILGAGVLPPLIGVVATPSSAIGIQVISLFLTFVVGATLLQHALPRRIREVPAVYDIPSWRRSAAPLVLLNVVAAANAQVGTILLSAVARPSDAGTFNVALRVTTLVSFVMVAAMYPLSPLVARLYAANELARMQRLIIGAARGVLFVSVPVALILVVFPAQILSVFGPGFSDGAGAVRIMVIGDLVNVLTGFGGVALVMSGRESDLARSVLIGAVLNVGIVGILVPLYGIAGAAIAAAIALAASNIAMTWLAWRGLGVWAAVLPNPIRR
jgi:O-antigen/teichoic acid export membrane protein